MPLDRAATLRTAEKLIRQGKLDAAIAEYRKVLDDQPKDWNTVNTLGDLLFRAGQIDKAVDEYERIADQQGPGAVLLVPGGMERGPVVGTVGPGERVAGPEET